MYILVIDKMMKRALKTAFVYLLLSLFCILFGAVYEMFSHGVYSLYMICAFVFPLAGGSLPFLIIALSHTKNYPDAVAGNLYHSGIATLTVGSILQGVLDIYGTTNRLLALYWMTGIAFAISGIIAFLLRKNNNN